MILHLERHCYPYEYWDMYIDLKHLCSMEGEKWINDDKKRTAVITKRELNKIFRFILKNAESEQIEQVQNYLNEHSKSYGDIFRKIQGGVTKNVERKFNRV